MGQLQKTPPQSRPCLNQGESGEYPKGVRPNQERRRFPHRQSMTTPQHREHREHNKHHDQDSPVGEAMAWASRIIAIGIAMFLPAVAGNWLDSRLGTGFLGMAGLVLGFVLGLTWLAQLSRRKKP